jgi:hypothetical protein
MIRSSSSIELIELSKVRHLDVLYSEEEQIVRAHFTLRDGSRLRGNLLTRRIQLQEPFGSMLSVPMKALDRISFKVDAPGGGCKRPTSRHISRRHSTIQRPSARWYPGSGDDET